MAGHGEPERHAVDLLPKARHQRYLGLLGTVIQPERHRLPYRQRAQKYEYRPLLRGVTPVRLEPRFRTAGVGHVLLLAPAALGLRRHPAGTCPVCGFWFS